MYSIDSDGWFEHACKYPSDNFNERPLGEEVSLLLIHNISLPPGQFGTGCVQQFFCNTLDCTRHRELQELADLRVSAHVFIDRQGKSFQFVSLLQRAWHAGVSAFDGRENCNDFSIGIELEGEDHQAYSAAQYRELAAITIALQRRFPAITLPRIAGHCDVAPQRKTDPGPAFDWHYYRALITAQS